MIYWVAPKHGKKNPMIYISICSTVGSISIMAIKGIGIALKMTFRGDNQFKSASTYVFMIMVVVCILTQMNYFNKALSQFSTNMYVVKFPAPNIRHTNYASSVNPLYYVTFTTFTLIASFILFSGFNTTDATNTISLLCGFLTIFAGVYLLNLSREDPDGGHLGIASKDGDQLGKYSEVDGIPVDGLTGLATRMSMQGRRSGDEGHRRSNSWHLRSPITGGASGHGRFGSSGDNQHLMHSYDLEANNLGDLAEDSEDEETSNDSGRKRTSFEDANGHRQVMNGTSEGSAFGPPRRARTVETERVGAGGKSFDRVRR